MKTFYIQLLFLLLPFWAVAQRQSVFTLTGADSDETVDKFSILVDKSYTFEQVLSDTTLRFVSAVDSTRHILSTQYDAYWIKVKVHNPSVYAEKYMVEFLPMLDNTLYYFNENEKKWITCSNGVSVNNGQRNIWLMPCVLQGNHTTTLYIKANLKAFRGSKIDISAALWFEKEAYVTKNEQFIELATWVTVFVFLLFLLYNTYVYFIFKDKTYIYYLIAQIGGLLYILTDQYYCNVLLPFRFCVAESATDRYVLFHDMNEGLGDLALALILIGYVQITRTYLETRLMMPKQDRLLKYLLGVYLVTICTYNVLIFCKILPIANTVYWWITVLYIGVVLTILYVAILSYYRGYKWARYFLVANIISICIFLGTNFYSLFIDVVLTTHHDLFAKIAVIAQAFCLAIALAQRVLLIQEELKQKQLEAQELTFQNTLEHSKNELLEEKLASNNRELASTTLYMYQKNELLAGLKIHVQALNKSVSTATKEAIKNIESVIQNNLYLDDDWERFRIHFEQVHPDFFKNLQAEHPTLTKNEIRLCAYFHINLSTKEIAAMLNIDPASVRKAKMRLNKKMNMEIPPEDN
jgi:DNA-binding CsgD family transcriptional regulator